MCVGLSDDVAVSIGSPTLGDMAGVAVDFFSRPWLADVYLMLSLEISYKSLQLSLVMGHFL